MSESPVHIEETLRLESDCHCTVLDLFAWNEDEGDIWLEFYVQDGPIKLRYRIRDAWRVLRGGMWPAGMVWKRADAVRLHEWLGDVLAIHPARHGDGR